MTNADGSFLDESQITKTAMDFAEVLVAARVLLTEQMERDIEEAGDSSGNSPPVHA